MRNWRKSTWVFLVWTLLMVVWLMAGASNADCTNQTYTEACNVGVGLGATFILFIWFLGAVPMSIIWYATRPKDNVTVYGPEGQTMLVSEKEAKKRVSQGWTYQRG